MCIRNTCKQSPGFDGRSAGLEGWRLRAESNRRTRLCRPLHDHSATQPLQGAFLLSVFFRDCGVGAVPVHRLGRILMYWHTLRFCARRPDTSDRLALAEKSGLLETPFVSYCILNRRPKKAPIESRHENWSGKRDSNSRPQPWQGCALPAELFPQKSRYSIDSA